MQPTFSKRKEKDLYRISLRINVSKPAEHPVQNMLDPSDIFWSCAYARLTGQIVASFVIVARLWNTYLFNWRFKKKDRTWS